MAASYSANFSWAVVGHLVLHLGQRLEDAGLLELGQGDGPGDDVLGPVVELEHQLHHAQLLVQGHIGVDGVVGVLLEKAHRKSLAVSMMSF